MKLTEVFRYCPRCGSADIHPSSEYSSVCPACGFEVFANAAAAAAAFIWNKRGELLFVIRSHDPSKGMLDLPGGFVSPGETAEETLRREIKEELGILLGEINYAVSFPNSYYYKGLTVETLDFYFEADLPEDETIICGDDAESAVFYPLDGIPEERIAFISVKNAVKYLKSRRAL